MMKISVFDKLSSKETVENTNGIVLDSILLDVTTEENLEKDTYICTVNLSTLNDLYKTVHGKSILKLKVDYGYEYFTVENIDTNIIDSEVEITGEQITYDRMKGLWINNIAPTNLTVKDAITWIYERCEGTKELEFDCNIADSISADYVRMNFLDMLNNNTNGLITKKCTGEILRRGYKVYIKKKIEFNNNIEIRSRKNLTGFTASEDFLGIITKICPTGYNSPVTDVYISSSNINKYKSSITKEIHYDNIRLESDVQDNDENKDSYTICANEADMRKKLIEVGNLEFSKNHIDEPKCDYDVNFVELSQYDEYKDYKALERVTVGENVRVVVEDFGTITARCYSKKYNVLTEETTECKISNIPSTQKPQSSYEILQGNNNLLKKISDGDSIIAEKIKGYLNSRDVSIRASRKVADKQDYIVAISECLDKESPLYGAIMWGTGGIYLSTQRTADGKDWDWSTAITSKGITADVIDTGTLRAITITNADASFILDLSKSNGIIFKNEGRNAIQINKNEMSFFGMDGNTKMGYIRAFGNTGGMYIGHNPTGYMMIGASPSEGVMIPYITFDLFNKYDTAHSYPITIEKDIDYRANMCVLYNNKIGFGDLGTAYISKSNATSMLEFYGNNGIHFNANYQNITCTCNGMGILGGLTVSGQKQRMVKTKNYGNRTLNAYETAECYFGDIGEAVIGEDGEVKIDMDNIFLETVNTKLPYQVFITKYGKGDCWVSERTETYFIIEGTPNLQVGYEIKAKQIDYTTNRLEEFKERRI